MIFWNFPTSQMLHAEAFSVGFQRPLGQTEHMPSFSVAPKKYPASGLAEEAL